VIILSVESQTMVRLMLMHEPFCLEGVLEKTLGCDLVVSIGDMIVVLMGEDSVMGEAVLDSNAILAQPHVEHVLEETRILYQPFVKSYLG
jgi:hypothetical protein